MTNDALQRELNSAYTTIKSYEKVIEQLKKAIRDLDKSLQLCSQKKDDLELNSAQWVSFLTEEPDFNQPIVCLFNDGSGASLRMRVKDFLDDDTEDGYIDKDGALSSCLEGLIENYSHWAYCPDGYKFWKDNAQSS